MKIKGSAILAVIVVTAVAIGIVGCGGGSGGQPVEEISSSGQLHEIEV